MKKDARPGSPFSLRVSEVQPEAAQRERAFGPGTAGLNALLLSSEQLSGPWPAILEKIRDQIHAATATPAPADFNLAPDGSRTVFPLNQVTGITWKQVSVDPPSFNTDSVNLGLLSIIPGAVGQLAYGKFVSPDYEVHPGEYIPQVGTLTGTPIDSEDTLAFSVLENIRPMIETFPLEQAADAYARMMQGKARFRMVLVTKEAVAQIAPLN